VAIAAAACATPERAWATTVRPPGTALTEAAGREIGQPLGDGGTYVGGGIVVRIRSSATGPTGSVTDAGLLSVLALTPTTTGWQGSEAIGAQRRSVTIVRTPEGIELTRGVQRTALRRTNLPDLAAVRLPSAGAVLADRLSGGPAAPIPDPVDITAGSGTGWLSRRAQLTAIADANFAGIEIGGGRRRAPVGGAAAGDDAPGDDAAGGGAGGVTGVDGGPATGGAAVVPPFLKVGMRMTFELTSSSSPPAGSKDGPSGARSIHQVTITGAAEGRAAAEVRSMLSPLGERGVTSYSSETKLIDPAAQAEYWSTPRLLAALQTGNRNGVDTRRVSYPLNGVTYRAIRITTTGDGRTEQSTYDLDTGLLIIWGMEATLRDGTRQLAQLRFVRMRQVALPWIGQQPGQTVLGLRSATWRGTYTVSVDNAYELTSPMTQTWDVIRSDALSITLKETTRIDLQGGAPQKSESTRVFSIASVWIDPTVLRRLRAAQVLDDDPVTELRTSVLNADSNVVVLIERGAVQSVATAYDLRTGLLSAVQLQQRLSPGTTTIFLQRTGTT
jgi:hypothetical protein